MSLGPGTPADPRRSLHIFIATRGRPPRYHVARGTPPPSVDPRVAGGRIDSRTTDDLFALIDIDGEEHLSYKAFPMDVRIFRPERRGLEAER